MVSYASATLLNFSSAKRASVAKSPESQADFKPKEPPAPEPPADADDADDADADADADALL